MQLEKARIEFAQLQRRISAIEHATSLVFFDGETSAPPDTADNRIRTLEVLNDTIYKLKFGDETTRVTDYLRENEEQLTFLEKRSLELLKRESDRIKSVPKEKYIQYESLISKAQDALHRANDNQDYDAFLPYLEEIVERLSEFAAYSDSGLSTYDYYLDKYETGMNTEKYDKIFDVIKAEVPPLLQEIMARPQVDDSCLKGDFPSDKQADLAVYIMELLRLDLGKVGLATGDHPFTSKMGSPHDERIVTKYSRKDFSFSLYNMLFECGHTLSEMGQQDQVLYTLIEGTATFGLLEAQTRFYENVVGRSREFIEFLYPELETLFPETVGNYSSEELYRAVNKVQPSPIRIGSDEVTNNLHVLVRYEVEKAVMDGSLSVRDLPDAWAEKYKKYLNVEVKNPVQGLLQDIHWSSGDIGYFPTAALGNIYLALTVDKMNEDIDLSQCIREGYFETINKWNREHIWKNTGLYDTKDVMEKFVGVHTDCEPYIRYLKGKYREIYSI